MMSPKFSTIPTGRPVKPFQLPENISSNKTRHHSLPGFIIICNACGNHIEVDKADDAYCRERKKLLQKYGLKLFAAATHLVSQCICDLIDERHKSIVPEYIWGDGSNEAGVFGGYLPFGDRRRYWNFRSLGHGDIDFEEIIRALNHIKYTGPLFVELEDSGMDREHGAAESCEFVRSVDFPSSDIAFDSVFEK